MKSHLPFQLLRSLVAAGLCAAVIATAEDSSAKYQLSAKLSAPGKPATLRIDMPWADIHIVGVDGDTVSVQSSLSPQGSSDKREDGLRRLDDEVSFELTEHDNVVSLHLAGDNPMAGQDAEFKIFVPRAMALDVRTETGGDLAVKSVDGDIDISNMNGAVELEDITGSTVVNTMNGEVHVTYAKVPQKLVSITSMNGEVSLRVPLETKANVRLRTQNGSILTDFDDTVLKTKTEGKSFSYGGNSETARQVARAAADATRAAMQVAREVSREVERAVREESDVNVKVDVDTPTAPPAPSPDAPARAPRPPHALRAPLPPIIGGKLVSGTLNGGGVDIKISSMNGEITLRQTHAPGSAAAKTESPVSVQFQDPDSFTDVRENNSTTTSTDYLDTLRDYLQQTAAKFLSDGQRLEITVTDIDLAGENLNNQPNQIRVMKDLYAPKIKLKFQLLDGNGKVLKEGERRLTDTNYLSQAGRPGSSEPLYYDKQLLKQWVQDEFRTKS
jgi:hypothetical protein